MTQKSRTTTHSRHDKLSPRFILFYLFMRESYRENGGTLVGDLSFTQSIFGLSEARHLHLGRKHKRRRSHECRVFWGCCPIWDPMWVKVKKRIGKWMYCFVVWRLLICLLVQQERRCKHLAFCCRWQRLQYGEILFCGILCVRYFSMHLPYLNLRVWVSKTLGEVQKRLNHVWWIYVFESHLLI